MGAYSDRVIADGASAYWRLGESSGTTAVDAVGGANGTISGGVTLGAAGALADGDKAMAFDGATGKIDVVSLSLAAAFTMEAWLKTTAVDAGTRVILSNYSGAVGPGKMFLQNGMIQTYQTTGGLIFGARVVADGQWHHVAWTQTATLGIIWIDGTLDVSQPRAYATGPGTPANIGTDPTAAQFWSGAIDEVAIYPRALTAPEVAAHYTLATATGGGVGGVGARSLGYWKQVWPAA